MNTAPTATAALPTIDDLLKKKGDIAQCYKQGRKFLKVAADGSISWTLVSLNATGWRRADEAFAWLKEARKNPQHAFALVDIASQPFMF